MKLKMSKQKRTAITAIAVMMLVFTTFSIVSAWDFTKSPTGFAVGAETGIPELDEILEEFGVGGTHLSGNLQSLYYTDGNRLVVQGRLLLCLVTNFSGYVSDDLYDEVGVRYYFRMYGPWFTEYGVEVGLWNYQDEDIDWVYNQVHYTMDYNYVYINAAGDSDHHCYYQYGPLGSTVYMTAICMIEVYDVIPLVEAQFDYNAFYLDIY